MIRKTLIIISTLTILLAGCAGLPPHTASEGEAPGVDFRQGSVDGATVEGIRVWQLPDAPRGSKPDQSWLAVGSDPQGNIYVSGHDHQTNSMLYKLDPESGYLQWVGDAQTASRSVDNWEDRETAEKFHTRPTYHQGRVYVATLDKSSIDDAFRSTRGFHWYAYDVSQNTFSDLSATEPEGVGAPHLQVVTIQADPVNNRIYGMTLPENKLLYYDIAAGQTSVIGSPNPWSGYFYSNRFMWTDSRGSVYITAGTKRSQWNMGEDAAVLDSVWRYTPGVGFEDTGFELQTLGAIEVGQWNAHRDRLYVSDDMGNIYRFTDADRSWEFLGRPDFPMGEEDASRKNKVWVFQLDPSEEKIYVGRSDNRGMSNEIWEYDIASGDSALLSTIPELDELAGREAFITGYDSWDSEGSFYISAFSMNDFQNAFLIGINPEKIR